MFKCTLRHVRADNNTHTPRHTRCHHTHTHTHTHTHNAIIPTHTHTHNMTSLAYTHTHTHTHTHTENQKPVVCVHWVTFRQQQSKHGIDLVASVMSLYAFKLKDFLRSVQ